MEKFDYLIVGGGLTGGYALKTLVDGQAQGTIGLISADSDLPYDRPPLSKSFLLDKDTETDIAVNSEDFYDKNNIKAFLNTKMTGLNPDSKTVSTDKDSEIGYDKLLLATGATPRHLDNLPDKFAGKTYYLRTLTDSKKIKEAMKTAQKAHIIGASFIGMELASGFAQKGIKTTILDNKDALYPKLGSQAISDFFEGYYKQKGVEIIHNWKNDFSFETDLLAVGIGVNLNLDWAQNSGLKVEKGIEVDEYLKSNLDDIWVGGDIANFYDPTFEKRRRIEHWDTATRHGEIAAKNMLGQKTAYDGVSYYFSDIFDLSFDLVGDNTEVDRTEVIGDPEKQKFGVLYFKSGLLKAFFALGLEQETKDKLTQWIENREESLDSKQLKV